MPLPLGSSSSLKLKGFRLVGVVCSVFVCCCLIGFWLLNPSGVNDEPNVDGRVTLQDGRFALDGKPFFPMVINYIVALHLDSTGLWVSPSRDYMVNDTAAYGDRSQAAKMIRADFRLMRELGFNAVRVVGVGELITHDPFSGKLSMRVHEPLGNSVVVSLLENNHYNKYFEALDSLFAYAEDEDLKVIFLTKMTAGYFATENHLARLVKRFKDYKGLLAYDLFNEPLYFDPVDRKKSDVKAITGRWKRIIRKHAPGQLMTLGLVGIREAFEWDPTIVETDFISFHPYEYEPEQVRNEIAWYGKFVKTPWIIGETSIPADNDSIPYEDQRMFAVRTLEQSVACGAIGYSWWQYKDVEWRKFHADYMGVLSRKGVTFTTRDSFSVEGSVKPVADVFIKFNPSQKFTPASLPNYYNYSSKRDVLIRGRVLSKNGDPMDNGVIMGWNSDWTKSYHTVTDETGSFELGSDFPIFHCKVTALGWGHWLADLNQSDFKTMPDGSKMLKLGDIVVEDKVE